MKKPIVGILFGLLLGFIVVYAIEAIGHLLFPVPFKVTIENLEEYAHQIPLGSMLMVLLAHFLGAAIAVFTCLKMSKKRLPAFIVAGLFFSASVLNLLFIPHPTWFTIVDVVVIILGILIAFKLGKIKQPD